MERNENGLSSPLRNTAPNAGNNTGNAQGPEDERDMGGGCRCESCGSRQLAMVYSPMQCWRRLYTPEEALIKGTLFEELNKPYEEVWR